MEADHIAIHWTVKLCSATTNEEKLILWTLIEYLGLTTRVMRTISHTQRMLELFLMVSQL